MEGVQLGGNGNKDNCSLPPGFRFHPTDEELITFYLSNKIADANFTGKAITDVDLNKCEPWDLPAKAKMGEKEWYFFNLRDRKYPTGIRTNRATNAGYWKTTGKDKEIFHTDTMEIIGMKKTLVFYKGRAPRGEKTNWVMHEYRIHSKTTYRSTKDEWVVCRVFRKSSAGKKYPSHQPGARTNPYTFETCSQGGIVPPPMMQFDTSHFPLGRNFISNADLTEISRVLRGSPIGNLPFPQQLNYPGAGAGAGTGTGSGPGCFTISGLNLNLGSSMQPGFRGMGSSLFQQAMTTEGTSTVLTSQGQGHGHGVGAESSVGFGLDMNNSVGGVAGNGGGGNNMRFQNVEPCLDLEGYWPSTY